MEEKMSFSTYTSIADTGMKWEVVEKSACIAGFIAPPLIGLGELGMACASWIHLKTTESKKTKSTLRELRQYQNTCLKIDLLFKRLLAGENATLASKYYAFQHIENIQSIIKKLKTATMVSTFQEAISEIPLKDLLGVGYADYADLIDTDLYSDKTESKVNIEQLLRQPIAELIDALKAIQTDIYQKNEEKMRLELLTKAQRREFDTHITRLQRKYYAVEGGLSRFEDHVATLPKKMIMSFQPPFSSAIKNDPLLSQLEPINEEADGLLSAIDEMFQRVFMINKEAIEREKENKEQIQSAMYAMKGHIEKLQALFDADENILAMHIAQIENELNIFKTHVAMITHALMHALRKRATREMAIHGAACLSFAGSYIVGPYQWQQRKKRKKEEIVENANSIREI
jgi:hypothetical protein